MDNNICKFSSLLWCQLWIISYLCKQIKYYSNMEEKKKILAEQASKIEEVINVLRTKFGEEYEDELNYLNIVKDNLKA